MIACFGDAIVDLFACPRGSDVASAESFVPHTGGAPANVALVAARLGARSRFVGAVGRDAHGDRLVAALAGEGVDTRAVVRVAERTGVTFVRVGLDGARSFLFYRRGGADLSLARGHLAALPEPPLAGARWLHVCSSALLCEPLASAARGLLEDAAATGVALSLDLNVRAHLWDDRTRMEREVRALAEGAAIVKASEEDLEALGLAPTLDALCALAPRAVAVLTLAERGAVARVGGRDVAVPAPRVAVVDATGAGDAFVAAMLAALEARGVAAGAPQFADPVAWERLLRVACDVGARAVTALGATEGVRELAEPRAAVTALHGG